MESNMQLVMTKMTYICPEIIDISLMGLKSIFQVLNSLRTISISLLGLGLNIPVCTVRK